MLVSFLKKTSNQYGDWMERMFLAHICIGPTGKTSFPWASALKSLENNNLLTQQFHDFKQSTDTEYDLLRGVRALERKFGIPPRKRSLIFSTLATRSSDTSFAALVKLIEENQLCKKLTQPSQGRHVKTIILHYIFKSGKPCGQGKRAVYRS